VISQTQKHRYVYFVDNAYRKRLNTAILSYPTLYKLHTNGLGRVRGSGTFNYQIVSPCTPCK
jgi:hypothetical protein